MGQIGFVSHRAASSQGRRGDGGEIICPRMTNDPTSYASATPQEVIVSNPRPETRVGEDARSEVKVCAAPRQRVAPRTGAAVDLLFHKRLRNGQGRHRRLGRGCYNGM